jgi:hypothetical protein
MLPSIHLLHIYDELNRIWTYDLINLFAGRHTNTNAFEFLTLPPLARLWHASLLPDLG